ncbi:CARD PYD and [Collichthys lucidus]|uniref:CARD PYD and n=1 Tax=Collichthys lucidus TaxID=240159 RepID=A0A4V6ASA4_COLLU|nr:CARD PYD and [Collichthys lucidus]
MDSFFTEPKALQVAIGPLRQINFNQEAKTLKQETKALLDKGGRKKKTKPAPAKENPSTTKKNPSTTKKNPSTTKKKASTTKKKASTIKKKASTTKKKASTTKKKALTTKKKPSTTKKKASTTKKKALTTKKKPSTTKESLNMIKFGRHKDHFVDKHQLALINRVSNVAPILDDLLDKKVIQQEMYDDLRKLPTTQKMMREIFSGCLKAGKPCKDIFYESLVKNERYLIDDLKNWDALTEFASDNPEVLEEIRFNRAYMESREAALSSGQNGKVLVGVPPYRWLTLKDLYESKDLQKIRQVQYLRTKKSTCIQNSKMAFAIDYILQRDAEAAAASTKKRTCEPSVQSNSSQPTNDSGPVQKKQKQNSSNEEDLTL